MVDEEKMELASERLRLIAEIVRAGDEAIQRHTPAPPGHPIEFLIRDIYTMAEWLERHPHINEDLGAQFINELKHEIEKGNWDG